jgi:hypothetical protein
MTWLGAHWLDLLGWGGSALLVFSLLQSGVLRFRILNLIASVVLVAFNAFIPVWPMVTMNAVLAAINVWFIVKLVGHRHDEAAFEVLEVAPDEAYLHHLLRVHGPDIARFQPGLSWSPDRGRRHAFLVQRGDETVGVVLLHVEDDLARVDLDYVTPRFRNFSPGEFVWRRSGTLATLGVTKVVTPPGMVGAYYDRLGFRREGRSYVLDL